MPLIDDLYDYAEAPATLFPEFFVLGNHQQPENQAANMNFNMEQCIQSGSKQEIGEIKHEFRQGFQPGDRSYLLQESLPKTHQVFQRNANDDFHAYTTIGTEDPYLQPANAFARCRQSYNAKNGDLPHEGPLQGSSTSNHQISPNFNAPSTFRATSLPLQEYHPGAASPAFSSLSNIPSTRSNTHPQDLTIAPPTPAERHATYAHYTSGDLHITLLELCTWFAATFHKPLTILDASSIIRTKGETLRASSGERKSIPKLGISWGSALEQERQALFACNIRLTKLEGRAPNSIRLSDWWTANEGGRQLAPSSVSGIMSGMRRRYVLAIATQAARKMGMKDTPEWDDFNEQDRVRLIRAGLLRALEEDEGGKPIEVSGPWVGGNHGCSGGFGIVHRKRLLGGVAATEAGTGEAQKRTRSGIVTKPEVKKGIDEHVQIGVKMVHWMRRQRDSRRISTLELERKAAAFWVSMGNIGTPPDFTDWVERFKVKYNLITNEGGPYPLDMLYMYDMLGMRSHLMHPGRLQNFGTSPTRGLYSVASLPSLWIKTESSTLFLLAPVLSLAPRVAW